MTEEKDKLWNMGLEGLKMCYLSECSYNHNQSRQFYLLHDVLKNLKGNLNMIV